MYFINISLRVKYNQTLKALLLHLYESTATALGESLVTNKALGYDCPIFATQLSPSTVYFIQTGSSTLSNT